ncbi:MAG: hypothetical protein J5921_01395, partial [Clostridia bacterium]|nr:hypothetical protein [Clostridia bacterium]
GSLNEKIDALSARGVKTLFSFATCDRCSLEEASGGYPADFFETEDPYATPSVTETPFVTETPATTGTPAATFTPSDNPDGGDDTEPFTPNDGTLFEDYIDAHFSAIRISKVRDYVFEPEFFWNSEWHVNGEGRTMRTERLAADILAYLESLEEPDEEQNGGES